MRSGNFVFTRHRASVLSGEGGEALGGGTRSCVVCRRSVCTHLLTHPLCLPAQGSVPGTRPRPTSAAAQRHCRCPRTSLRSDRRAGAWMVEEVDGRGEPLHSATVAQAAERKPQRRPSSASRRRGLSSRSQVSSATRAGGFLGAVGSPVGMLRAGALRACGADRSGGGGEGGGEGGGGCGARPGG
jgi:hypothetical protein